MNRRTLGINVVRHEQMRHQKGGILPMGAPWPVSPILPMLPEPRPDHGRPGGLLAFGLSQLRRLSVAASLTRRTG